MLTYKFTGKELDEETGLYYFGARYYDPKTSTWASCDPAFAKYLPDGHTDRSKLPGRGGVYNSNNLNVYHYAGNNPIKYVDPNGEWVESAVDIVFIASDVEGIINDSINGDTGGGLAVKGVSFLIRGGDNANAILKAANTGLKFTKNATNLADAAKSIKAGEKITSDVVKKSLRAQARNIMEKAGIDAGIDIVGKEVHHLIPLEYAHKFGPNFNPNALENLAGLTKKQHGVISEMWGQFRRKFGDSATPDQIKNMVNETLKVIKKMK